MSDRIVAHVSPARLATYRAACGAHATDPQVAALYMWQLELHAAWHEVLGVVEMILRHSLDTALGDWNAASTRPGGGGREWLTTSATPLSSLTGKMAADATTAATNASRRRSPTHPRAGSRPNHDDLVAQLTFGNLAHLLPTKKSTPSKRDKRASGRSSRENLWLYGTINAFPNRSDVWPAGARGDTEGRRVCLGYYVGNMVERLRSLRNRIGHHEQTLSANHAARHDDAITLVRAIDPGAADALEELSTVLAILGRRPQV